MLSMLMSDPESGQALDTYLICLEEAIGVVVDVQACVELSRELEDRASSSSERLSEVLKEAGREFKRRALQAPSQSLVSLDAGFKAMEMVADYRRRVGGESVVYHGTTLGMLPAICEEGIVPGCKSHWMASGLNDHVAGRVFFSSSYAAARSYAQVASSRFRGRMASVEREPIVIRLRADRLPLRRDMRAAIGECYYLEESVSVDGAVASRVSEYRAPDWLPARELALRASRTKQGSQGRGGR